MSFDPFATAPADDEAQAEPTQESVGAVHVDVVPNILPAEHSAVTEIVTTFKLDGQAPWIVVHAQTVAEANAVLNQEFADYVKQVKKVASFAAEGSAPAGRGGNTSQRQSAPQGATQPPEWFPPAPAPGWVYKTGFKKDGSGAWHAWAPPQKGGGDWQFHNPPRR
jgi:hypothetical protein